MLSASVQHASTGFSSLDGSNVHSTPIQRLLTLVHAFVTSRVDYCNAILAEAPKSITDKLQRVVNAAARIVSDTRKYDRGPSLRRATFDSKYITYNCKT